MEQKWISVKDKKSLPKVGHDPDYPHASEMILLSDGEFVYYGQYECDPADENFNGFLDSNGDDFVDDGVEITHWMPLPEPPIKKT